VIRRRRPQVTVYSRAGCHLCERAERDVARLARGRADVEVVDIDTDPTLIERYTVRVPVVAVDGVEVAEFQLDPAAFRAALRRARQRSAM
jgi:glutaredoxin